MNNLVPDKMWQERKLPRAMGPRSRTHVPWGAAALDRALKAKREANRSVDCVGVGKQGRHFRPWWEERCRVRGEPGYAREITIL